VVLVTGIMKIFNSKTHKSLRQYLRNESPKAERVLWSYLRRNQIEGFKFRRQSSIGNYIVDFYCPKKKLVIEVDGDSHFSPEAEPLDYEREEYLKSMGAKVIRFTNLDIYNNIEEVVTIIMKNLSRQR
jgi:very-short-patch-repair endonuclease